MFLLTVIYRPPNLKPKWTDESEKQITRTELQGYGIFMLSDYHINNSEFNGLSNKETVKLLTIFVSIRLRLNQQVY